MQNKSIVSQLVWGLLAGAFAALMVWIALGAINKTYAQEENNCSYECTQTIPWCLNWKWFHCTEWGVKCIKHELVCTEPDPTPSPEPSVEPSATPEPPPLSEARGCRDNCQPKYEPILCHGENPPQVQFNVKRTSPTSVQLNWWAITGVDHYSVLYGYESENEMGIPYLKPDATQVDINGLEANRYINVRMMAEYPNKCVSWSTIIDP